ncbi:hypothetical protein KAR91_80875 [Candidatus Pacearchaeota archaeon]|nr:hypothetical protein [Candidatus Pacearchaeota archaeon]
MRTQPKEQYKVTLDIYEILTLIRLIADRRGEYMRRSILNVPKANGDCDDLLRAITDMREALTNKALKCKEIANRKHLEYLLKQDTLIDDMVLDEFARFKYLEKQQPKI